MGKVVIEKLDKVYPGHKKQPPFRAVRGIDLEIEDGEFMVLVGPSGCGKSTTLRMIAGLEDITGGTIAIDGRVINDIIPKERGIAMVFQNYALYPHLNVFTNMAFGLQLAHTDKDEIKKRVDAAAKILGLEKLLGRKPKALSGGQRQRVAVGRAIVRDPKVFLFDEPLSNLDAKMRVSMRSEISKLHQRLGTTMVYVTHDQVEAMTMGDRICVMKDGEIMQVDDPLTLYRAPANLFVAGFIGSPPMNLIRGEFQDRGGERWFAEKAGENGQALTLPMRGELGERAARAPGREVILGLRPESITDAALAPKDAEHPTARLRIDLCEPMGAETFLYLAGASHPIIARIQTDAVFPVGEEKELSIDLSKAHLFDPASENVIR